VRWLTPPSRLFGANGPEDFDRLYGVAIAPGGVVVYAEAGAGRVLSVTPGHVEVLASGWHALCVG
jgi:hypothetical protein